MSTAAPVDVERLFANAPHRLRERPQWVCWKYIQRAGKATKCPIDPIKPKFLSVVRTILLGRRELR